MQLITLFNLNEINMIKILQINSSANVGSTGRIVEQIGELVLKEGWESYIAYGRYKNPSKSQLIKVGSGKISQSIHFVLSRLFDAHGLGSYFSTKVFLQKIDEIRPDIVHLHNIHGYFLNYPLLFRYLSKKNIPIVWTMHDCWSFTGHCSYFDIVNCNKWETGCHHCPAKKNYPQSLWLDRSRYNYELKKELISKLSNITFVPVSDWLGELTKQSFLGKYPIKVIHNGIDISVFKPYDASEELKEKYGLKGKKILLGVASEWDKRKGMDDYLLLRKILPSEYAIVMIGIDENKNLPAGIIGIKQITSTAELVLWYSTADILMNLSYEETFGLTTVEGFACGTPTIVYNKTASPELVDDKTGIVVEAGNIQQIAKAVNKLMSLNMDTTRIACRERAERLYNQQANYAAYLDLYKELARGGKKL